MVVPGYNAHTMSRDTHAEHAHIIVIIDMYIKIDSGIAHTAIVLAVSSAHLYYCRCCFADSTIHTHVASAGVLYTHRLSGTLHCYCCCYCCYSYSVVSC
jgi:hypothetical protein